MQISRRAFVRAGLGATLAGLGYASIYEPGKLTLERVTARLPYLPTALEGFRIALLSDFHLHPFTRIGLIERAVEMANALEPDLTVLLGDYVDATADAIDELGPALGRLNARHGVFGVIGNHDIWKGSDRVQAGLRAAGLNVLVNAGLLLPAGPRGLFLAGLDSVMMGQANLGRALARHPAGAPTVLLVHEPDFADLVTHDARVWLQLSGHSHGGQVRLPRRGALRLPHWATRYDMGLYQVKDLVLYTNRGIGMADVPMRVNCPPEVTELTLVAK